VFGLNFTTTEKDLEREFGKFGKIEKVNVVLDGPSKRSRGFAFIYFDSVNDAEKAREELNGTEIAGFTIRVDFSITTSAHRPTPGVYFHHGKATRPGFRGGRGEPRGRGRGEYRGRGDHRGRGGSHYRDDRYYDRRPPPPSGYYDRGYDRYDKYDRDYYGPPRYREESRYHDYHHRDRDHHRERDRYYEDRYRGEDRYREDRYREPDRYDRPPRDYYERDRHYDRGYERYPPSHHYPSSSRRSPSPGPPPPRRDY
jgi:RNA recognition motif-containing protein